jgi:hypothetical protein
MATKLYGHFLLLKWSHHTRAKVPKKAGQKNSQWGYLVQWLQRVFNVSLMLVLADSPRRSIQLDIDVPPKTACEVKVSDFQFVFGHNKTT